MNESFNPTVASSNDSLNVNQVPVTQNPVYANQANTVVNNNVVPVQNTIPINNNVRIFAPRGILTVFFKMRYKCGKCGYTAKYSQW